jgi:hypothetical protein
MESRVEFTDFIQPICLPSSSQNVENVQGKVAAYGRTKHDENPSEIPLLISLTTFDLISCFLGNTLSSTVLSARTFCANNRVGSLCQGKLKLDVFYAKNG